MSFFSTNLSNSSSFSFQEQESDSEILFSQYSQKDEHSEFYEKVSHFDNDSNNEINSQEINETDQKLNWITEVKAILLERPNFEFCEEKLIIVNNKLILISFKNTRRI